jgi:DNA-binding response OmpR family regulator
MNKESLKILLVEDNTDLLDMYEEIFKVENWQILKATSGMMALEIFQQNQDIRVIISDSKMGAMSGMELLKKIKDNFETLPAFYLLTGDITVEESDLKKAGGKKLILKPFDLDEILETIKKEIKF